MPRTPPPTGWRLHDTSLIPGQDLVAVGADLEPGTLLAAYRSGLFPMGLGEAGEPPIGWWSPDPRGVLLPGDLRVSRSLARARRRFAVSVDRAFAEVVQGCADPARPGRWITPDIADAYTELHRWGWAHSIEVLQDGVIVGGLYGVAIGGLFAGESMFHRATDASKVALMALVDLLDADERSSGTPGWLIDVQWSTPHLAGLGVRQVPRSGYLQMLPEVLRRPLPKVFDTIGDSRVT